MWSQDNDITNPPVTKLSFLGPDLTSKPSMSFLNETFENVSFELASDFIGEEKIVPKEQLVESVNGNKKEVSEVEITLEVHDLEKLVNSTEHEIKTEPEVLDPDTTLGADAHPGNKRYELESNDHIKTDEQHPKLDKKKRKTTSQKRKWPEDPTDCDICGTHYTTKRSYQRHYKIVHELVHFECKLCDAKFRWPEKVPIHVREVHQGIFKTYPCDKCDAVFRGSKTLKDHKKRYHPPPSCDYCKIVFDTLDEFNEHLRKEHIEKYCI